MASRRAIVHARSFAPPSVVLPAIRLGELEESIVTKGLASRIKVSGLRTSDAFRSVSRFLRRGVSDDSGITAIEYALLASLIALAIIGAVTGLSTTMQNILDDIAASV
jgi:pilus assembly protein Flp/PilA